jgi:hypothetical protein
MVTADSLTCLLNNSGGLAALLKGANESKLWDRMCECALLFGDFVYK